MTKGLNHETLEESFPLIKNLDTVQFFTFTIMDENRQSTAINFQVNLDTSVESKYDHIVTINSVTMGAQDNSEYGSYYSILENLVYNYEDATAAQDKIDIIYFFGKNDNTMSAPNLGSEGDILGVDQWDTRNGTYYAKSDLTLDDFEQAQNDSILLQATGFNADTWKSKAKEIKNDDIYFIKMKNNKFGLIKIISVEGEADGKIEFALKHQE